MVIDSIIRHPTEYFPAPHDLKLDASRLHPSKVPHSLPLRDVTTKLMAPNDPPHSEKSFCASNLSPVSVSKAMNALVLRPE